MGIRLFSVLFIGLILVATSGTTAENSANAQKESQKTTVVIPGTASITITPGTKFSIRPVKTAHGVKVQLETSEVVIKTARLRVESKDKICDVQIGPDDLLLIQSFSPEK